MNVECFQNREMELTFREETKVKKCCTSKYKIFVNSLFTKFLYKIIFSSGLFSNEFH
jgi:hypothetical protein